ncbi:MAG TPA: DUF2939 domain-containing protein [Ramlibacter sp.]|nr:DUF2939 domain-containing protein [Ramlibacter sp.]
MRIGKATVTLVIAIAAATAAYWYWSPHLAMRDMQNAAQRGDADALNAHIDFPAVRESLRGQVAGMLAQKMGEAKDNPFAALGTAIGMAFADQMLQVFVRPETIAASMRTGLWDPLGEAPASRPAGGEEKLAWSYEREGANKVIVRPHRKGEPADPQRPAYVLVRHGFADWKLSEIRIPLPLTHN